MEIIIKNPKIKPLNLAREIGYTITGYSQGSEINFIKRISKNPYPRFHIYIKEDDQDYILNLHLDQKKPSYNGSSAHNAEYEGPIIEKEIERIKSILSL